MVAVIWKHSNAYEKTVQWWSLQRWQCQSNMPFPTAGLWLTGNCSMYGKPYWEKWETYFIFITLVTEVKWSFSAVPTNSKHPFSIKKQYLQTPVAHLNIRLEVVSRHLHTKPYLTPSPLARTVGKTQCAISILIAFTSRITTVPLVYKKSHHNRTQSSWSSEQFGWPCQLSNRVKQAKMQ